MDISFIEGQFVSIMGEIVKQKQKQGCAYYALSIFLIFYF